MKIYQSSADYSGYSLPTVSLAYFLRYPNPLAKHVLSTDTISQHIDPATKRLHTVRLHLKKSKVPAGILKFLPQTMGGPDGSSQTYVLEKSVIDVKEGWMETESRNMEFTGVLSVVEKQMYRDKSLANLDGLPGTRCNTTVTLVSRLGQTLMKRRKASATNGQSPQDGAAPEVESEEEQPKQGWLASLSTAGIQRTIELVGVKRTQRALMNSSKGMEIVLERLRNGGIKGVLEGMRHDRMEVMGGPPMIEHDTSKPTPWREVWQRGSHPPNERQQEDRPNPYD